MGVPILLLPWSVASDIWVIPNRKVNGNKNVNFLQSFRLSTTYDAN